MLCSQFYNCDIDRTLYTQFWRRRILRQHRLVLEFCTSSAAAAFKYQPQHCTGRLFVMRSSSASSSETQLSPNPWWCVGVIGPRITTHYTPPVYTQLVCRAPTYPLIWTELGRTGQHQPSTSLAPATARHPCTERESRERPGCHHLDYICIHSIIFLINWRGGGFLVSILQDYEKIIIALFN